MRQVVHRIEDFIQKAKEGKEVEVEIELHKVPVTMKIHPEAEITEEREARLFTANFRFKVEGEVFPVSKTYIVAFPTESVEVAKANLNIANARIKEDYSRMKAAGIKLEEKFF